MSKKFILPILFLVGVLISCGGQGGRQGKVQWVTATDGQRIPQGGTLITGLISDVKSLNPYVADSQTGEDISGLLFLSLADINADLQTYSPRLAKSWKFINDRKTLTFHLRTDVKWWDGMDVTARDVVFSHRLAINPDLAWAAAGWKQFINDVSAPNDSTVVYHFSRVYPYQMMDAVEGKVLPEHVLKQVPVADIRTAEFNQQPVGDGPFMLKSWQPQQQIELVRNPTYYEKGKPHLDRLVFRIVPDRTTLLTQLKSGEIDFLEDIPARAFQQIKEDYQAGKSTIKPYEYLGRNYDIIAWNNIDPEQFHPKQFQTVKSFDQIPNPYFADSRVRRAMTYAIDRGLLREAIGYGMLMPMHGAISPILWAHDQNIPEIPYDPEKARQLLAEAGWRDADNDGVLEKDGREFQFTMKTNAGNVRREQACTLIQEMLKKVGIRMDIRQEEGLTFFNDLQNKQFEAALLGWSVSLKVDFATILNSQAVLRGYNFITYRNPEFDRLNAKAALTVDPEAAKQLWSQVEHLLQHDQPYTWLYYMESGHGLNERFHGVTMDHRGAFLNLRDWWVPVKEREYWLPQRAKL